MTQNKQILELEGTITEALPNTMFRVLVSPEAPEEFKGRNILCTLSGKMRMYRIRVMPGDDVRIEVTPYDKDRGRITFRKREMDASSPPHPQSKTSR
jgi:translation initiation factor IF-1